MRTPCTLPAMFSRARVAPPPPPVTVSLCRQELELLAKALYAAAAQAEAAGDVAEADRIACRAAQLAPAPAAARPLRPTPTRWRFFTDNRDMVRA